MDKPVLIGSIGAAETRVLVQIHQTRPNSKVAEPELLVRFADYASDDVVVMQLLKDG